jgi:ectoine hydroxylase-related dioxygenase (phytanoyl-CoA dioxygenase family)
MTLALQTPPALAPAELPAMDSTLVLKMEEVLASLGVTARTLTEARRRALDERGYLVVPGAVGGDDLDRLRGAFDRACAAEGLAPKGTRHPRGLVDADAGFLGFLTHPEVLAAARYLLAGPFQVASIGGRDPMPGFGQQSLHIDCADVGPATPCPVATVLGLIDGFAEDNGATRLVPGSHRARRPPPKSFADPASRHPGQVTVIAPAGSALVFDGRLWHGGTRNRGGGHRRAVHSAFVGRERVRRASDQLQQVGAGPAGERPPGDGALGLAPAVRFLLGSDPE